MKLIRLTTRDDEAIFDATFNANLTIPANAKIALQSVAINTLPRELIVDETNNQIIYQIANGVERTIKLPQGKYSVTNIEVINRLLTNLFNNSCTFETTDTTQKMLGIEWICFTNADRKESIGYDIGRFNEYSTNWTKTGVSRVQANNRQTWGSSDNTNTTDFSRNAIFPYPLARGNSFYRTRIDRLQFNSSVDDTGYIVGITSNLDVTGATLDLADIYLGVHVTATGNVGQGGNVVPPDPPPPDPYTPGEIEYRVIYKGAVVGAPVACQTYEPYAAGQDEVPNEFVELGIDGNAIVANVYRSDGTKVNLYTAQFEQGTLPESQLNSFYPVMAFRGGNASARLNGVSVTPSPYGDQPVPDGAESALGAPPRPPNANPNDRNFLFFEGISLARFFGYLFDRIPRNTNDFKLAYTTKYVAAVELQKPQEADSFIVQLLNLQLDSFDSYSSTLFESGGQRQNILAVIPSTNETGSVVHVPPYPTFINLLNEQPLLLRNIRARVVRNDYSEISIDGLGSMVILID